MDPSPEPKAVRLQKFLADAGVASRRKSEELILAGHVSVNGAVVRVLGTKVDPETDDVRVDTLPVKPVRGRTAILLSKPKGILSTTRDDRGRTTVLDLLPGVDRRLWPVGRLDEESEGLILLSDDGELTNLVTHPSYGIPKTYDLRLRGMLTAEEARKVESGVWLSEGRTGPTRIRIKHRGHRISRIEVTLTEGRNRELRRIFAKLGHPVLALRRIRIGDLTLKGLKPGYWRRLSGKEIAALKVMARKP